MEEYGVLSHSYFPLEGQNCGFSFYGKIRVRENRYSGVPACFTQCWYDSIGSLKVPGSVKYKLLGRTFKVFTELSLKRPNSADN